MNNFNLCFLFVICLFVCKLHSTASKSVIVANYHNILLFIPKETGGNDDLRVIYDVRNSTLSIFKYVPVIVSVAYDSKQNIAYAYLESAVTSYIIMLKWAGGRWCHQVLFDFPATQYSKYMYHSLLLMENYIYWTTDRFIMSGRIPGYEKRFFAFRECFFFLTSLNLNFEHYTILNLDFYFSQRGIDSFH